MPLEIRELQINVSVDAGNSKPDQQQPGASSGNNAQQELISECVELVINTMEKQKER
jgi:Family of unknown function (DUF5908)